MGCSRKSKMGMVMVVVAAIWVVGGTIRVAEGQETPSCAASLVPCANFLNSTKPPASCCTPLKQAVETQLTCLCNLYKNPNVLQSLGVNITQALALPKYCGITGTVSQCSKVSASAPTGVPTPGRVPGSDSNGVGKMAWAGMSSLLIFWAVVVIRDF